MRKKIGMIMLAGAFGCANISNRVMDEPVVCSPYPYASPCEVWCDCVCAPLKLSGKNGWDGMWCLDTAFLPVDVIYVMARE